jgi:hypothetical protein
MHVLSARWYTYHNPQVKAATGTLIGGCCKEEAPYRLHYPLHYLHPSIEAAADGGQRVGRAPVGMV